MSRLCRVELLATSVLLAACAASTTPTTEALQPSSTSAAPNVERTLTANPLRPSVLSLISNGTMLAEEGGVYFLSGPINPEDELALDIVLRDDDDGTVQILGEVQPYTPSESNEASVHLDLTVPSDLTTNKLPVLLASGNDSVEFAIQFEPGDAWLPDVAVPSMSRYVVGDQIDLEVFDLNDRNPMVLSTEQILGLGDRYGGLEYVTSQPLAELTASGELIRAIADTPGNYRIRLTLTDGENEVTTEIDLPVYWPRGGNPFTFRGISIDFWGPEIWHELDYVPTLMDEAKVAGANYIQISPNWHAASITGDTVRSCVELPQPRVCVTETEDQLRSWIRYARNDLDMGVLLKPHLMVGDFDFGGASSYDAQMWEIRPANPTAWFDDYSDFILHYARIAEEEDVEIFSVGAELMFTLQYSSAWRNLIAEVRDVYSGELTYSNVDLWTNGPSLVTFWDALDFIGMPYYYPGSLNDNAPEIDDMVQHILSAQRANLSLTMSRFQDPVLAMEMGRPNFDGTNYDPWDFSNRIVDNQEVVDWLEAALLTQLDLMPRFEGTFIWVLKPRTATFELDWDFRNKPLFEALSFWFSD